MISIINTLIICGTVLYCIWMVLSRCDKLIESTKDISSVGAAECDKFTEEDLDKAYDDLAKTGELPPDLTEFIRAMSLDIEE